MSSEFYRAFEDEFRGEREEIKSRLTQYLPFLQPLKKIDPNVSAVDLGCGRGEWLELMREHNISARGVDLDEGMLAACRERNLDVETGDAITFLKSLPEESIAIVSAFHLVEHVSFDDFTLLVQESLRVLKPAGLLILETPNSENLSVGASGFYVDPTHERPIPPQLLEFLPRNAGFARAKILRLNEPSHVRECQLTLLDVLAGVSPDCAVVAQKAASDEELGLFDSIFDREFGVSLVQLAMTYSKQGESRVALAEQRSRADSLQQEADAMRARLEELAEEKGRQAAELEGAQANLIELRAKFDEQQATLQKLNSELIETKNKSVHWARAAENFQAELQNIYRSRSWRVTSPLRNLGDAARWLLRLPKRCVRWSIVKIMMFFVSRPLLSKKGTVLLKKIPKLHGKLRQMAQARGLIVNQSGVPIELNPVNIPSHLTSHAGRIYLDLARTINGSHGGRG